MEAVAAISATDVWAAGYTVDNSDAEVPLVERWDGSGWRLVPFWEGGPRFGHLFGAAPDTGGGVWLVGDNYEGVSEELIARHTDEGWSFYTVPGADRGHLSGVDARTANDAWVVGDRSVPGEPSGQPMSAHWDGTRWTHVPMAAAPAGYGYISDVDIVGPDDVWAVGASGSSPLIQHWDGARWSVVEGAHRAPGRLLAVTGTSPNDVWAVGDAYPHTLIQHWDGERWSKVGAPSPGTSANKLWAADAVSPQDVWAVGGGYNDGSTPLKGGQLVLHFDGREWSLSQYAEAIAPSFLRGVDEAEGMVWAVGAVGGEFGPPFRTLVQRTCPIEVNDTGFSMSRVRIQQGDVVTWRFTDTATVPHAVEDCSPLELFDSGPRPPGGSFTHPFPSASTYRIRDPASDAMMVVAVPVKAQPSSGSVERRFTLTWSVASPPPGLVFDVQVLRPGSSAYEDWRIGGTRTSAAFRPHSGTGTYLFRARLRNSVSGAATMWSPAARLVAR